MFLGSSPFRCISVNWIGPIAVFLMLVNLSGCYVITSERKVIGTYELATEQGKITLDIRRDHTFTEKITWRDLTQQVRSGKWKWTTGLDLDSLWIPPQFCPDYIVQSDARSGLEAPRYSSPGHWTIGPEWRLGHVILPIFPDSDVEFRLTKQQ